MRVPRTLRRSLSAMLLLTALPAAAAAAQFRTEEWVNFHNSTFVGNESEAARLALFEAEEHLAAGRPLQAGRALLGLLGGERSGLARYGERLVVPVARAVALKLQSLPVEVREELRRQEERSAALGQWGVEPLDFADRFPLSEAGEKALLQVAIQALLRGEFDVAAGLLEEYLHWPNDFPGELRVMAAARLEEALARQGHAIEEGPLYAWPEGSLLQAGRSTELSSVQFAVQPPRVGDWPTLGGHPSRIRRASPPSGPPRPVLCREKTVSEPHRPENADHRHRYRSRKVSEDLVLPTGLPLVERDVLWSFLPGGLHAIDLKTGQDLFPPLRYDFDFHVDPERFAVEWDRCAASIHGELLYVTLWVVDRSDYPERPYGALFGLDLSREALILFGRRSWEAPPEDPGFGACFVGPAEVSAGRLLVPAVELQGSETECELWSLDPRTGELIDRLFLARSAAIARHADRMAQETRGRLIPSSPVSLRNGVAYVCTNLGVVAAVRALDMSLQWLFRYNRILPADSGRYDREAFFVTGGWPGDRCRVLADRLLVAPMDSRYLYSLARWPNAMGDLLLNDPVEREQRLGFLGASASELYFLVVNVAEESIQVTDHSGSFLWHTPLPSMERVTGVPAVTDRYLYIPTDRRIYRLDLARQGQFDAVLAPPPQVGTPFPEFGVFGDLVATDEDLISNSDRFLCVYELTGG